MSALRNGVLGGVLLSAAAVAAVTAGDDASRRRVGPASVYYGDPRNWSKAAVVDADAVFAEIEEYRRIVDAGLEPGSVQYEILMARASARFRESVKKTARAGGYDLIARPGSLGEADSVSDVTQDVIARL